MYGGQISEAAIVNCPPNGASLLGPFLDYCWPLLFIFIDYIIFSYLFTFHKHQTTLPGYMMDDSSMDTTFAGYIQSRTLQPLGVSKKINAIPQNQKLVESRAHQRILNMVAGPLGDLQDLETVSSCFKCLYLMPTSETMVGVIKKHHILVIKLIESKMYKQGLDELHALQQYLKYAVGGRSVRFDSMSILELMDGIPGFKKEERSGLSSAIRSQLVTLVVTYHFLVLQCMLQHISTNLKSVATNKNELGHSIFKDISRLFLHNSNFLHWLQLSKEYCDVSQTVKYQNNAIKMINGYVKIIDILVKNLKSHKLKVFRSCFLLKLAEYNGQLDADAIIIGNELVPFINDLKKSNIDISTLTDRILPSSTVEIEKHIHSYVHQSSVDSLHLLQLKLTRVNGDILRNTHIMEMLQSDIDLSLMSILNSHFRLQPLSRNHLIILDSFTKTLKKIIDCNIDESVIPTIQQLYTMFSTSKQLKRIRNLSNLLYNLGNKLKSVLAWTLSIEYESFIYTEEAKPENFTQFESKSQKIVNSLLGLNHVLEASLILDTLIQLIEVKEEREYLATIDNPLLIHLMVKCITMRKEVASKFFGENNLSDSFKTGLAISVFEFLEKLNNTDEKTLVANEVMNCLAISDEKLRLILIFHYYDINSLHKKDIPIETDEEPLLVSGILLQKLINLEFNEGILRKILILSELWITQNGSLKEYEEKIFTLLIQYLKFNGLTGQVVALINLYKKKSLELKFNIFLENELYHSLLKLSLQKDSSDTLININTMLKHYKVSSIHEVINFNLHQFEYCVQIKNNVMAKEKFGKILKVLRSRTEFNLNGNSQLKLIDKFNNLLLVAKFQFITSKFNFSLGNHYEAFRNIKISIKLLYSIVKKCGGIARSNYNKLKWETTHLLFDSYKQILMILKHLGLSRDFLYFFNEYEKLNKSNFIPLINCLNQFDLIVYNFYLQADIELSFLEVDEYLKFELVSENVSVNDLLEKVSILRTKLDMDTRPKRVKLSNESVKLVSSPMHLSYSSNFNWNYILSMVSNVPIQDETCLASRLISSKMNMSQAIIELGQMRNYSILSTSTRALPCIVNEGFVDKSLLNVTIINALIECKEKLLSFLTTSSLKSITLYQLRDLNSLLGKCLSYISSMTIFKVQTTLLFDLYYLQDMANSIPFKNDRLLNHSSSNPDDLLPSEIGDGMKLEQFETLSINFNLDLNLYLPDNWSIINLDVCSSGDLILTKFMKGKQPFFMRLPSQGESTTKAFSSIKNTFQDIIHQSDLSTKTITTSKITTKDDRKRWWKLRFSLDLKLKELLNDVEQWIGGFKSIFNNYNEDSVYNKFKADLVKIINSSLPSRKGIAGLFMEFDENILKAFYSLPTYEKASVDDLLYFIIDSLTFHGEQNRYEEIKFEKLHRSIEILFDKYYSLRSPLVKEHLVLIPSSRCAFFPWESMDSLKDKSISRVPSVDLLIGLLKQRESFSIENKNSTLYMVNPGGDLLRTEEKFKTKFQLNSNWNGWIGQQPEEDQFLLSLLSTNLFVYLGHGGCDQYLKTSTLLKKCLPDGPKLPPSLLIGCSSGALKDNGYLEASGNIYNWLTCGSPMALVNLWDVTDKDIDHFSLSVFEKWCLFGTGKNKSICEAVVESRSCCTLQYLNGAAPIVYGLPLYLE